MTIEIFKTDVSRAESASIITASLLGNSGIRCVNFDLEDCDRVLRVEFNTPVFDCRFVIDILKREGFSCEILD